MYCKRLLPLAALTLAACGTTHGDTISADVGLGESVKYNAAVQTVNPDPVYAEGQGAQPGDSADRGVAAVERYRRGAVTPVEEVTTTSSSGGGSGSR